MSSVRSLWQLARPRMAPYLWFLVLGGYGFAHWDRALTGRGGGTVLVVLLAWTLLHVGTMWLNAALDQDEGEVLWGESAPVPERTSLLGYVAVVGCVIIASFAGPVPAVCAGLAAGLAVLYSHPDVVWKGHPVGGPFVNAVGYGILSPVAGFAAAGVTPTWRSGAVLVIGVCGIMAAYYAAQGFQGDEDRARGYRTLVARRGKAAAVGAMRVYLWLGFACGLGLALIGWLPRWGLVLVPLFVWVERYASTWQHSRDDTSRWAKGFATRLLVSALIGLALLVGLYVDDSVHNRPVAGLGTAAGHPPDRPLLPPHAMRRWERQQANSGR